MATLLAGAVAARSSGVFGILDLPVAVTLELGFVVALALSAAQGGLLQRTLAVGIASVLGLATLASPFDTAISLSILHNLTPLAFLWEISQGKSRWRVMLPAFLVFIALPILVATGLPRLALAAVGMLTPSLDPLSVSPLSDHLYIYVPVPLLDTASAVDLFSASVVAQCAHYAAVIVVLPALLAARDPAASGIVPWPRGSVFFAIVVILSSFALYRFANGFGSARALYGIAASLHAWIEIPLVIVALTRRSQSNSAIPASADAPFAAIETISARSGVSPVAHARIAASTRTTSVSANPSVGQ
jgi:hypothetical protein